LLFKQFLSASPIASVKFGTNIFAVGFDVLSGYDFTANFGLDCNFEKLAGQ
jgi:hypothetical protein